MDLEMTLDRAKQLAESANNAQLREAFDALYASRGDILASIVHITVFSGVAAWSLLNMHAPNTDVFAILSAGGTAMTAVSAYKLAKARRGEVPMTLVVLEKATQFENELLREAAGDLCFRHALSESKKHIQYPELVVR